jgi:hypothetical protein
MAFIRLLPMSERAKDIEILAMRHQLAILQQQIDKPRVTLADREFLAALLTPAPQPAAAALAQDRLAEHDPCAGTATSYAEGTRTPPAARAPADPPTLPRPSVTALGRSPRRPSP